MKETYYTEVGITDRFLQFLDSIEVDFIYSRTKFGSVNVIYEKDKKLCISDSYLCAVKRFKTRWQDEEQYKDPYSTWEIVPGGDGQLRQGPEYCMSAEDELKLFENFAEELEEFCAKEQIGIVIHTLITGRGIFHPTAFTPLPGLMLRYASIPLDILNSHLKLFDGKDNIGNGSKFYKLSDGEGYSIYCRNKTQIINGSLYEPARKVRYLRAQDSEGYVTWNELEPIGDTFPILDIRKIMVLEKMRKQAEETEKNLQYHLYINKENIDEKH